MRHPKPLAECVEPLLRPVMKARAGAAARLMLQWPKIVGDAIAARAQVESLQFPRGKSNGGTVTLNVAPGFATEIHYQQPIILERIAAFFGYAAVTRLVISATPLSIKPQRPKKIRTAALSDDCRHYAAAVEDSELRQALTALAETFSAVASK